MVSENQSSSMSNDTVEEPRPLESLPDRPLRMAEGDSLAASDAEISPLSILVDGDDFQRIYTLWVVGDDRSYVLGYAEREDGWVVVDSWDRGEWTVEEQDETVQAWLDEHYGDQVGDQGLVDVTTGDVQMGYDG